MMGFVVEIEENEKRKTIRYTGYPLFMYCLLLGLAIGLVGENWLSWAWFAAAPFIVVALVFIIPVWKLNGEIKKAMRVGSVKVLGSKWSLKEPLTFEIAKGRTKSPVSIS